MKAIADGREWIDEYVSRKEVTLREVAGFTATYEEDGPQCARICKSMEDAHLRIEWSDVLFHDWEKPRDFRISARHVIARS